MWRKKSTLRSRIHNCSIPRSLARSPLTLSLRSRALALHICGRVRTLELEQTDELVTRKVKARGPPRILTEANLEANQVSLTGMAPQLVGLVAQEEKKRLATLLEVTPASNAVEFTGPFNTKTVSTVELTNKSSADRLAFKIRSNNHLSDRLVVRPSR
jgi:hypothetical protein